MTLLVAGGYAQISDFIWYICIAGHSLGALMHLKTKTQERLSQ